MRVILLLLVTTLGCTINVPPADPTTRGAAEQPECRMGSDGQQACGYDCKMGSDGIVACADTADGRCSMGADGHVYCSELASRDRRARVDAPPPDCRLNSDGSRSCGYNCRLGSDGYHYCSSVPEGECALNSDGSWACP